MKGSVPLGLQLTAFLLLLAVAMCAQAADELVVGPVVEVFPSEEAYQRNPDVAYGADRYLVVWQDGWNGEDGDSNIFGARLDAEGTLLDHKPIEICTSKGVQDSPSVAYLGNEFVIVWADLRGGKDYDIYFARVSAEGRITGRGQPLVRKAHNQTFPRLASGGELALAVWQDLRDGEYYRIFGSRLREGGRVLDGEGFQVSRDAANTPAVAASKDAFLVAWTREHLRTKHLRQIGGTRVGQDGELLGEFPGHRFHGKPIRPAAASDGKDFLFVCSRVPHPNYWGWGGPSAFYAARVLADGTTPDKDLVQPYKYKLFPNVLDGAYLREGIWMHKYADVASDGKEYVAIWTQAHIQNRVMLTNFDLFATRIRFPGWQKLDSPTGPIPENAAEMDKSPAPGIAVADTPRTEAMPALAGGPAGKLLVAYELHKPEGAIQLVARVLDAGRAGE